MPNSTRAIDRAAEVAYDATASGLAAADVQAAIDELFAIVDAAPGGVDESNLVHRTGAETIAGAKTFADPMTLPVGSTIAGGGARRILYEDAAQTIAADSQLLWEDAAAVLAGGDAGYLAFKPGDREYRIGTSDAGGAFVFGRGDISTAFLISPATDRVNIAASYGYALTIEQLSPIVLCAAAGGGAGAIQLGRRLSDSHPAVGATVECWTITGQTSPALSVMTPGGATREWCVMGDGAHQAPTAARSALTARGIASQVGPLLRLQGTSSTTTAVDMAHADATWADATHATRKGRMVLSTVDYNGTREGLRVEADGANPRIGFLGADAVARPSGDIGAALVSLGLMTNPTGLVSPYRFGASGTITTGSKPPMHRVRSAGTATRLDMTLSAGTASATIEVSTDNGSTWPTSIGPVSVASGKSGTATVSTAIAADALIRVNYTAATGASDPVVTLYMREA